MGKGNYNQRYGVYNLFPYYWGHMESINWNRHFHWPYLFGSDL